MVLLMASSVVAIVRRGILFYATGPSRSMLAQTYPNFIDLREGNSAIPYHRHKFADSMSCRCGPMWTEVVLWKSLCIEAYATIIPPSMTAYSALIIACVTGDESSDSVSTLCCDWRCAWRRKPVPLRKFFSWSLGHQAATWKAATPNGYNELEMHREYLDECSNIDHYSILFDR